MNSCLFIVSTPIGNLQDMTLRALDVIKQSDFIICEDTRVTSVLLKAYDIHKELVSMNAFNEKFKIQAAVDRILTGQTGALLSDAGTPGISDPGTRLISLCIKNDIKVIPVPGASAVLAGLAVSGLPTDSFVFEGFLPQKKGRQKLLKELSLEKRTIIVYESSHRIKKLIKELCEYFPGRQLAVCRELTKKFEEVWRGTPEEIFADLENKNIKGEFCVVIAPSHWKIQP